MENASAGSRLTCADFGKDNPGRCYHQQTLLLVRKGNRRNVITCLEGTARGPTDQQRNLKGTSVKSHVWDVVPDSLLWQLTAGLSELDTREILLPLRSKQVSSYAFTNTPFQCVW
jgi:hypothetical protein